MRDIIISKNAPSTRIAEVFTASHIITLWEHKNERTAQILLLYIYTGLRISELYGIKIEDVHLKERYMIGGSKTDAGKRRIIPIAECIYPIVSALYNEALFNRSNVLLKSPSKNIYRTHFTKICQELNLIPGIRLLLCAVMQKFRKLSLSTLLATPLPAILRRTFIRTRPRINMWKR